VKKECEFKRIDLLVKNKNLSIAHNQLLALGTPAEAQWAAGHLQVRKCDCIASGAAALDAVGL
jgi:hypothetical protein